MSQHPRYFEVRQKRALNEQMNCSVPGCINKRSTLAHYCTRHRMAMLRRGSPTASVIYPRDVKPHLTAVRRLFAAQPQHPGLVAARSFVQDVMRRGLAGDRSAPAGTEHYKRLHNHGVTAQEIIEELCAVFLLSHARPDFLPDGPTLDHAIAKRIFCLAPLPRTVSAGGHGRAKLPPRRIMREWGQYLRAALAPFLVTVRHGVEQMPKARESFIETLRTPFEMPSEVQAEPIDRIPLPFKQLQ